MKKSLKLGLFLVVLISLWGVASVNATDYYVNVSKACTGDGTSEANAWCSVANVSDASLNPGDNIYFARGEMWREQLTVPDSGSSGSPITFGAYGSGTKPIINGADLVTGWEENGTNVWNASLTTEPYQVFFNGTRGTEVAYGDVNATNKWNWSSNVLRVYSTSDPDLAYTDPGIEASVRLNCIDGNYEDYITIDGLTLKYAGYGVSSLFNGFEVKNCDITYNYVTNIFIWGTAAQVTSGLIQNCTLSYAYLGHGILLTCDENGPNGIVIENNTIFNNGCDTGDHGIYHGYANSNIVRYNMIYDNAGYGVIYQYGADSNELYYNLIYSNDGGGMWIGIGDGGDSNLIYNNVFYNNEVAGINFGNGAGNIVKNNLVYQDANTVTDFAAPLKFNTDIGGDQTLDNNCYWYANYSGGNHPVRDHTDTYLTLAQWQSASSEDSNSIESDPLMTDPANDDFTLQAGSPCIDAGVDLGASYDDGLDSDSVWPNSVLTLDQDDYGAGWEIGAYVYEGTVSPTITFSCSPTSVNTGDVVTCSCSATDDVDSSPNVSYTVNPPTLNTGTFTTTCTTTDSSGNSASSTATYIVEQTSGSDTPTTTWTTYTITESVFEQGYTRELGVKNRIKVQIEGEDHFIGVVSISGSQATIEISSDPVQVIFDAGEDAKVDVTDDDFYDIYVLLNGITNNKANVTIQKIHEEVPEGGTGVETTGEQPLEEEKSKWWLWLVLGLVVVVLVIIIIVIYKHKRRGFEKISEITNR